MDDPSAATLADRGVAHLLLGRTSDAIADFQRSIQLRPQRAATWNDLAAAYLQQAHEVPDRWAEFQTRALDASERALELKPDSAEAVVNRSSARHVGIIPEDTEGRAVRAGRDHPRYNDMRDEDIDHFAAAQPGAIREYVEEHLLPGWASAVAAGTIPPAGLDLALAARLAAAHGRATGDGFLQAVVSEIRHSRNIGRAAAAYALFDQARARFEDARDLEAAELGRRAAAALAPHSTALISIRLLLTTVDYQQRRLQSAREQCAALLAETQRRRFDLLEGRARLVMGLIRLQQGEPVESVQEFERAAQVLERFVEPDLTVTAHYMLAYTFRTMGEDRRAWRAISRGLERVNEVQNLRRRQMVFYNASMLAQEADLVRGALWYQTLTLETAESRRVAGSIAEARTRRAVLLHRLSQSEAASEELTRARTAIASVTDATRAAYYDALLKATEGQILIDARRARRSLMEAITYFRTAEPADVPRLYLHAGRAALVGGDMRAARADFEAGIEILEQARLRVTGESERISYFDESWLLFRELVRLTRHQPDVAFGFAERGRARALLDTVSSGAALELRPAAIAGRVPADTALIQFSVLSDSLLIWVLRAGRVEFVQRRLSEGDLTRAITDCLAHISSHETNALARSALLKLHDLLIRPISGRLGGITRLVVVPDGALALLPFAALRDRSTGRYLIEDYTITYSPSSNHFLTSRAASVARDRVLIIGNPRFDRREYPHLADLPSAEQEAHRIASLYRRTVVLTGAAATRGAVAARLPESDVIHFGGHATVNEDYPSNSALLLAADARTSSALRIVDLFDVRLRHGALVILGACSTARGATYRLEGVQSIAGAFLAKGAGAVVASLWDVDDAASATLLVRFHEHVANRVDPATALARAQRYLITAGLGNDAMPHRWAAFISVGASASPARAADVSRFQTTQRRRGARYADVAGSL